MSSANRNGVVLYVRVSTEDQDLAAQRRELESYAATRGWIVIGTYQEKASASGRSERLQHAQLLKDAHIPDRGWARVLVWSLDRWSREASFVKAVGSIEQLEQLGVRFHSFKEPGLDSGEDAAASLGRDLLRGIIPVISAFEARRRQERTQLAMDEISSGRRSTRSGRAPGRPRRLTPDKEAQIRYLRWVEGLPWKKVAQKVGLPAGTCSTVRRHPGSEKPPLGKRSVVVSRAEDGQQQRSSSV